MEALLNIIGAACLGHLLADFNTHFNLPQKPFQCDMCMSFWVSIIPFILIYGLSGLFYSAISAVLSNLIYKYL